MSINILKPDNRLDFKSLDWQQAVATLTPKEAVRLLAEAVEAIVRERCKGDTPQKMSRQAELLHNAFLVNGYPDILNSKLHLFYRDVAKEMYTFRPIHEPVDYDH